MAGYTCPTCNTKMERDVLVLYKHTDQHIVDAIKKQNPQWVSEDGYCPKCLDAFKQQMGKAGTPSLVNISIGGIRQRTIFGCISLVVAISALLVLQGSGAAKVWRLFLFIPFFGAMLGLIQAREKVCVVLGLRGTKQTSDQEEPVSDPELKEALRAASQKILILCAILAFIFTALAWIL